MQVCLLLSFCWYTVPLALALAAAAAAALDTPRNVNTTTQLQAALNAAIGRGDASFTIPGGAYTFANRSSFMIHSAHNLSIRVPDSVELVFVSGSGVSFVDSTAVSIGNLTIRCVSVS